MKYSIELNLEESERELNCNHTTTTNNYKKA